jgi:hypothetical protein
LVWWATFVGTLAGLLLHGPFTAGLLLSRALDATLLTKTVLRTRSHLARSAVGRWPDGSGPAGVGAKLRWR